MEANSLNKKINFEKLMIYFYLYLFINLVIYVIFIYIQFENDSFENLFFLMISTILLFTQIFDTIFYHKNCLKFARDVVTLKSDYNILSLKTVLKGLVIVIFIFINIFISAVKCHFFNIKGCGM